MNCTTPNPDPGLEMECRKCGADIGQPCRRGCVYYTPSQTLHNHNEASG